MGEMSPWHWAIVIGVAILLFGARRLPDAARSLGRSARILKAELRDVGPGATPPDGATAAADAPATTTTASSDDAPTGTRPSAAPPGTGSAEAAAGNAERAAG